MTCKPLDRHTDDTVSCILPPLPTTNSLELTLTPLKTLNQSMDSKPRNSRIEPTPPPALARLSTRQARTATFNRYRGDREACDVCRGHSDATRARGAEDASGRAPLDYLAENTSPTIKQNIWVVKFHFKTQSCTMLLENSTTDAHIWARGQTVSS